MSATLRSFTQFILQSRLRAIGVTFALTFIPLIGTISIIITGLVTLRKGALEGFFVLLAASLPYFILLPFQPLPMGYWIVGIITLSNCLTWFFAALLNRSGNWSLVLEVTALIGIIVVTTAHVIKPDLESWWGKNLSTYITQMIPEANTDPDQTTDKIEKTETSPALKEASLEPELISFVNAAKPYATGALTASVLFTALLQLFAARWWQMALSDRKKSAPELRRIHLSAMAGFVFLLTLILSYIKVPLAQDLLPVLYLTFCATGLSLVHYAANKLQGLSWLALLVFYVILLGTWMAYKMPLVFQLLALAALLDIGFDWRERLDKHFP